VLVLFWRPGCQPCRELRAELTPLEAGVAEMLAVDADEEPDAVRRHGVTTFPTLVFYKRGRELHRLRGGSLPASTRALLAAGS